MDQIAEQAVQLGGAAERTAYMGEPNMSFGITVLTFVHVLLSLVGIGSGLVVLGGLFAAKRLESWTAPFW